MDLGAAAFWIFLAAVIVAGIWRKKHSETTRHETARLLIEKNQKLDEAQLKELITPTPPPAPEWLIPKHSVGEGYRILRMFGTILICIAFGLAFACVWRGLILGIEDRSVLGLATGIPIVAMLGVGFFVASGFLPKPPADNQRAK